jgi:triacylglycerol lipase
MLYIKPNIIGYSPYNALTLVKASKLAYLDKITLASKLHGNVNKLYFFDKQNTQGFIAANTDFVIISFRGTEPNNLKDWMNNSKISLIPGYEGRVHRGFSQALDDVWDDIVTCLPQFQDQNQPIFITGHSMGGSLATMTAVRLGEYHQHIKGIYTFGCPRMGDSKFVENYDKILGDRTFRIVNHRDIVTRLAPRSFGYQHVSGCWFFDSEGKLHNDIRYWQQFLETVKGSREEFLNVATLVKDHNLDEYKKNVLLNFDVMDTGINLTNIRSSQNPVIDITLRQAAINPNIAKKLFDQHNVG